MSGYGRKIKINEPIFLFYNVCAKRVSAYMEKMFAVYIEKRDKEISKLNLQMTPQSMLDKIKTLWNPRDIYQLLKASLFHPHHHQ